ncbi:MAG TPA: TonB-dependent receptor [Polyangiales bacterium]|nr:TonB-dependent receptor [Polyangiales bacterium]
MSSLRALGSSLVVLATAAQAVAQSDEFGARATVKRDPHGESVAASDFRLEVGELRRVPRDRAQNLLTLAPGILLTNHGGEGHTASMYLRGFDAGEGEDIELRVDGIPLNEVSNHHGHGYADVTFLIPELVSQVRVLEGPFDPEQADFAVAGSAEFQLGLPEPGLASSVRLGKYGRRRWFLGYRPADERARTFAAVALERGDGFGPQRAFAQASAIGQYEAKLGAGTFLRTLAFVSAQRWDTAGVVRADDVAARRLPCADSADAQFFCTPDPNQGGSGARAQISTILERTRGPSYLRGQLFMSARQLRTRENYTGFTLDPRLDGGPQRGDLLDGRTDALTLGLRTIGRRRVTLFAREHDIEVGVYARHDRVSVVMDRVRRELDVPYLTDFDRGIAQTNVAAHARLDARLLARLRFMLGMRADAFAFQVVERSLPELDRIGPRLSRQTIDAYGFAFSPRGTLDLTLTPDLHALLSVGRGARSSDGAALSQSEAAPFARVTAAETGLAYGPWLGSVRLEARSSVFFTRVSRDLVFNPEQGRNEPVGASQRSGALLSVRARDTSWFDLLGSATYTRAHLPPPEAAVYELFRGPRLPFIPSWLVRGDAVVHHTLPWLAALRAYASLGVTYVGKRPLPLAQWAAPYSLIDLALGARYRFLELSASVTNLFDARYREAEFHHVSNFNPQAPRSMLPARHFSAGAPRQWMLTMSVYFDPADWGQES